MGQGRNDASEDPTPETLAECQRLAEADDRGSQARSSGSTVVFGCLGGLLGFVAGAGVALAMAPKGYNGMGNSIGSALYWMGVAIIVGIVVGAIGAALAIAVRRRVCDGSR